MSARKQVKEGLAAWKRDIVTSPVSKQITTEQAQKAIKDGKKKQLD